MLRCPACGQAVAAEDAFCRRCGQALQQQADAERVAFMEEMAALFQKRLQDQPNDTDAAYNLALTYFYAQRYHAALPLLREVVEQLPDFAEARAKLALALWHTKEYAAGLAEMERAVAQAPHNQRFQEWRDQMRRQIKPDS